MYGVQADASLSTWSEVQPLAPGMNPTFAAGNQSDYPSFLSTEEVSALYRINACSWSLGKPAGSHARSTYARVIVAVDTVTRQTISLRMAQPKLGGRLLDFVPVNDTLPGITAKNFVDFLRLQAVSGVSQDDSLELELSVSSRWEKTGNVTLGLDVTKRSSDIN